MIEITLQDNRCSDGINQVFLRVTTLCPQHLFGFYAREAFIPEYRWEFYSLRQGSAIMTHPGGLRPFGTIHIERQPYDQSGYLVLVHQHFDVGKIGGA